MKKTEKEKRTSYTFRLPDSISEKLTELTGGSNYCRTKTLCALIEAEHARRFKKKAEKKS